MYLYSAIHVSQCRMLQEYAACTEKYPICICIYIYIYMRMLSRIIHIIVAYILYRAAKYCFHMSVNLNTIKTLCDNYAYQEE